MYKNDLHELRVNAFKKVRKRPLSTILKTVTVYTTGIYSELSFFFSKKSKLSPCTIRH